MIRCVKTSILPIPRGPRGSFRILLMAALACVQAGAQAPLPQPKPIVVAPLPRPGQIPPPPKNKPESRPAPSPPRETEPAARSSMQAASNPPAASYGSTPVPWPNGSTDPAHFPKEIPRFPGARRASFSMTHQTATAFFLCDDSPEEVAKFYLGFLERERWNSVPIPGPPLEGERIVIADKGDWTLRVDSSTNPFDGSTEVFLTAALKPLPPKPAVKREGNTP